MSDKPRVPVLTEHGRLEVIKTLLAMLDDGEWPRNHHSLPMELNARFGGPTDTVIACNHMLDLTAQVAGHADWRAFEKKTADNAKLAAMARKAIGNAATWELELPLPRR